MKWLFYSRLLRVRVKVALSHVVAEFALPKNDQEGEQP
jgi:hypothetical protein